MRSMRDSKGLTPKTGWAPHFSLRCSMRPSKGMGSGAQMENGKRQRSPESLLEVQAALLIGQAAESIGEGG